MFESVLWLPHKVEHRTICQSYIVIHTMTCVLTKRTTQLTVFETRLSGVIFHFSVQLHTSTNIINTYVTNHIYKLNILQVGVSFRKKILLTLKALQMFKDITARKSGQEEKLS